jgi:DNA-binding CsgD family transcriptional regulator
MLLDQLQHDDPSSSPFLTAERTTAEIEASRIRRADTAAAWADSARQWEEVDQPRDVAYCLMRQAERLLDRRRFTAAAEVSLRSLELASAIGANPIVHAVNALLERGNVRDLKSRSRSKPVARPHGLTARETQVLDLLARGHSNREIADALVVGERTAESHVSSILRKLGVTTRAQAAAMRHYPSSSGSVPAAPLEAEKT